MAEIKWKDRKRIIFGLPWTFTKYSLTEDRLFISTGLLSTKEDEVRLYRIMDLSLERKLWQRLFGLGTIKCCSADKTLGDFEIKNIKDSKNVKEMMVMEDMVLGGEQSGHIIFSNHIANISVMIWMMTMMTMMWIQTSKLGYRGETGCQTGSLFYYFRIE